MGAKEIYIQLRAAGLTAEGACGILGNMQAESNLKANIAQRGMTSRTDEDYTAAADMGLIDFAHDSVGYGLCQWTFWSRKQALLCFARECGTSVGNEKTQTDFCVKELREDYPALWAYLCSTEDVAKAAERVCKEYECPAVNNVNVRAKYAQEFFDTLGGTKLPENTGSVEQAGKTDELKDRLTNESVMHLQAILTAYGYELGTSLCPSGVDGLIGKKTVAALKDFAARLEAMV